MISNKNVDKKKTHSKTRILLLEQCLLRIRFANPENLAFQNLITETPSGNVMDTLSGLL
jgi:hypothetical protein